VDRTLASGARGRGFDSRISLHSNTPQTGDKTGTEFGQYPVKSITSNNNKNVIVDDTGLQPTHSSDTNLHDNNAICMHSNRYKICDELQYVVDAWEKLPEEIQKAIVAMVRSAKK
jgi:hypothetical protein